MNKYAVVVDDSNIKTAAAGGAPCPSCGSGKVDYKGTTPHCPKCGTKPWEREKESGGSTKDW